MSNALSNRIVLPLLAVNSWQCLAMGGNGRLNAFSAVRPPFVRPTAAQHFYADDNDENDNVNDDNDNRKHRLLM